MAQHPIQAAIAKISAKSPLASALTSDEWQVKVPLAIRERAQFSARVEQVRILDAIQTKLLNYLKGEKNKTAKGDAVISRSSIIADLRRIVEQEGLGTGTGSITDLSSRSRLGLIFDMQVEAAQNYARWKLDSEPAILNTWPAQRLIRERQPKGQPRDWQARWQEAGNAVGWEGAHSKELVALKTSPIWAKLSRFGTPWPPFDFGSGMGLEDVTRDEAIALNLITASDVLDGSTMEQDFNADLQASVEDLSPEALTSLSAAFGNQVKFQNGVIIWKGAA